ncbi:hypothetical protein OROMI_009599 [Orobanche minor]
MGNEKDKAPAGRHITKKDEINKKRRHNYARDPQRAANMQVDGRLVQCSSSAGPRASPNSETPVAQRPPPSALPVISLKPPIDVAPAESIAIASPLGPLNVPIASPSVRSPVLAATPPTFAARGSKRGQIGINPGNIRTVRRRLDLSSAPDDRLLILPRVPACRYCAAYKFYRETAHFCCSAGQVSLTPIVLPQYLVSLLTGDDDDPRDFRNMIHTYNNHFAFSSMSMHYDDQFQRRNNGVYTVRVQGQVYHFLGDLLPSGPSAKVSGLQFYIYDPEHQITSRAAAIPRLRSTTLSGLVSTMNASLYSIFLQNLSTLQDLDQYCIVIKTDSTLDQCVFHKPTSLEVAGVWLEDASGNSTNTLMRDIRVYAKAGHSQNIQYYYACYDPLQYVLMFPGGEPGWHGNIPSVGSVLVNVTISQASSSHSVDHTCAASFSEVLEAEEQGIRRAKKRYAQGRPADNPGILHTNKRSTVSCRQYYAYKLQQRPADKSYLLLFGRLLQQYVIDMYIKIESMRLEYFAHNQSKMRMDHYKGVMDSVISGIKEGRQEFGLSCAG